MPKDRVTYWIPPAFTRVTSVAYIALIAGAIIPRLLKLQLQLDLLAAIITFFYVPKLQFG